MRPASFQQLPLQIQLNDAATFDNFFVGTECKQLFDYLQHFLQHDQRLVYLWGQQSVGKSHLLQASCHCVEQQQCQTLYLPLAELLSYPPDELLADLEFVDLICIDDIELIAGQPEWEQALFHLYNRCQQQQNRLLVAASLSPRHLPFDLADLSSRMQSGVIFQIQTLTDQQKLAMLQLRASRRGLQLNDEVAQFVVNHSARDIVSLIDALDKLDHASLAQRRRITIPFIKSVLDW